MMINADGFFAYARERYEIFLNRQAGAPRELWTADPILQEYRFCNVFREDDTVTKWVREHITYSEYHNDLLGAMIIARWINRVESLERLLVIEGDQGDLSAEAWKTRYWDLFADWQRPDWANAMRARLKGVSPLVTGAYMIKTPAGMNKLEGLLWSMGKVLKDAVHLQARIEPGDTTLEGVHSVLKEYPYLGPFMAYEVVTDLRHTPLLDRAPDIMTWASAGPGAARGMDRVHGEPVGTRKYTSERDQKTLIADMRCLLQYSQQPEFWPAEWPKWEMREVEHTLCEFDKYERARLGQGAPKQRYRK